MHRGRAEVPQDRVATACQQHPARKLVAGPFADLGRRDVTNVVVIEQQQRAEIGSLERGLRAAKAIAMHAAVVHTLLEIDAHGAEYRQVPSPVVTGVNVFGGDLHRLAGSLVHGRLLRVLKPALSPEGSIDYRPCRRPCRQEWGASM